MDIAISQVGRLRNSQSHARCPLGCVTAEISLRVQFKALMSRLAGLFLL